MSPVGTVGAPPANWDSMSDEEQFAYLYAARPIDVRGRAARRSTMPGTCSRATASAPAGCRRAGLRWSAATSSRTQDCVDEDQWFDTGDIAVIHPDDSIQI